MSIASLRMGALCAFAALAGCIPQKTVMPPGVSSPFAGYSSALYRDDAMWLCRPDLPSNPCATDLSATEIRPDGSRVAIPFEPAKDPPIDCFYVYPTVDLDPRPGNHTDFQDRTAMRRVTLTQAARFQQLCRLYVPLYRQITVGTYAASAWSLDERLEVAFSDVQDAFAHYIGQHNQGRKIVLLGHSQGAFMVVELLRRLFDRDEPLRSRLLVGMPIGGRVEVAPGERSGATFVDLPLCSSADEIGCVVAFRTYRQGANLEGDAHGPPAGRETACVHPAGVAAGERAPVGGSFFLAAGRGPIHPADAVATRFVYLRGLFAAQCVPGPGGYRHLAISDARKPGDRRALPFDLNDPRFELSTLGLHTVEMELLQGDLIELVRQKTASAARMQPGPQSNPETSPKSAP